ncbi:MAG TPA: helix-turn-helix domain-containing protein [Gemmatimonadales bacterium]|nr:helix-turn-helix domain-containing protein [Gemmatimonadales bacterium]
MLLPDSVSPLAVHFLRPPYLAFEPVESPATLDGNALPLGAVLAVDVPDEWAWSAASEWVPRLRRQCPAAPVIVRLRRVPAADASCLRRSAELGVRAVLYEDEPPRETLQPALTDPTSLTDGVEEWLALRGLRAPAAPVRLIVEIFRLAPATPKLRLLVRALGRPERTVRSWFERAGLPGPGAWLAAAHATHAALRLQRERQKPLLTLAVECGYSDHSSLSRQAVRLFGARPGEIRQTLGWEGLLDRWLGRATPGRGRARPAETRT